jgi:hypothetical protein
VSYSSIAVANGLEPNEKLRTGQKLLIPTLLAAQRGGGEGREGSHR